MKNPRREQLNIKRWAKRSSVRDQQRIDRRAKGKFKPGDLVVWCVDTDNNFWWEAPADKYERFLADQVGIVLSRKGARFAVLFTGVNNDLGFFDPYVYTGPGGMVFCVPLENLRHAE